ncbi:hypothetical protein DLM45_02455 [Hyphomicrobium methylovorum]|uniref:hypothetical protein n=1 Tax=Hyphomicrobium methylovorum TaxID=84 RepID=UPI0015E6797A|nr:hypothetical protein [Hyphomicrobium methylovorum]MBA2125088.1 hypothetical protein [Hyphomicrobium methylovorum]
MTDLFDKLTSMRERIDELMQGEQERAEKLQLEIADLNDRIALANALAALKAAASDCRHERVRVQVNGARDQLVKILGAA